MTTTLPRPLRHYTYNTLPAHPDRFLAIVQDAGYRILVDEVGRWFITDPDDNLILDDDDHSFLTKDHAIRYLDSWIKYQAWHHENQKRRRRKRQQFKPNVNPW